ncbi:MAG: hypothetical protein LBT25_02620 [Candidatus Symbiothrix sp.]|nr:hypothetical protein [Candidatus Symbiothrix sp.]
MILFATGLFAGALSAQQMDEAAKRELEREVKASGDYLYGEAVDNTKDEAVKSAKSALLSEIKKETLNHPEWQFAKSIQAKDVEYSADMIELMRGNKFRVIAYIKKDNIQIVFDNKTPDVKIEDEKAKQDTTTTLTQPQTTQAEIPQPPPVKSDLLGQILKASSIREIQTILQENKRNGKAVSGTMDKLTAPEKAYLIIYKWTGEIVAILDKGSGANRKDLLSGEVKGNAILEQNQVIWFQLF